MTVSPNAANLAAKLMTRSVVIPPSSLPSLSTSFSFCMPSVIGRCFVVK